MLNLYQDAILITVHQISFLSRMYLLLKLLVAYLDVLVGLWIETPVAPDSRMCIIHSSSPGLRMHLQVGLISCAAVTRGKKPLPLLVEYIESR